MTGDGLNHQAQSWIKRIKSRLQLGTKGLINGELTEQLRPKTQMLEVEETQQGKFLTLNYSRKRERYYNRILKQVNEIENIKSISLSKRRSSREKFFDTETFEYDAMVFKNFFIGRIQLVKSDYYIWDNLDGEQHLHSHLLPREQNVQ